MVGVELADVTKTYQLGDEAFRALDRVSLSVERGDFLAVTGPSGSGRRLFTFEAATLGFFGGLIGVLIGFGFVLGAKSVISDTVKSGPVGSASFSVPLWLMAAVITVTTAIGLVSGFFPARRAARLDPVEALRYE